MEKHRSYPCSFPVRCQRKRSKLPPEGAVLEGGEEHIQRAPGVAYGLFCRSGPCPRLSSYNQTVFQNGYWPTCFTSPARIGLATI